MKLPALKITLVRGAVGEAKGSFSVLAISLRTSSLTENREGKEEG